MKKGIFIFSLALLMLVGTKNISAASSTEFGVLIDYNVYTVKKNSFQEITDYTDSKLVKETKADGSIVYYKEHVGTNFKLSRYGEWFKKINGKMVNYKESYEVGYKSKNEQHINNAEEIEYYVDSSKCKSTTDTDIVNDNCQSKNRKKLVDTFYSNNKVSRRFNISYNTNNKYSRNDAYSTVDDYRKVNDKLSLAFKVTTKRDATNKITKAIVEEYDSDWGNSYMESGKVDKRNVNTLYDLNNLKVYSFIYREFDSKKRLINYTETNSEDVEIYSKHISYFSNNKQRYTKVTKRSENDKVTYVGKIRNHSNGRLRGYIKYGYKNGIMNTRFEYVYNKNGNLKGSAYRYKTTYNKKGKKVKTYKSFYNKKGKIYKTSKAKHRVDFN